MKMPNRHYKFVVVLLFLKQMTIVFEANGHLLLADAETKTK